MSLPGTGTNTSSTLRKNNRSYLYFVLPASILVGAVLVFPVVLALVMSFFEWPLIGEEGRQFIGISNYIRLFNDPEFWHSLRLQMGFIFTALPIQLVIGFFVALLLNRDFPFAGLVRTLMLLPVFILPVVSGLTWQLMLSPRGVVRYIIQQMGGSPPTFLDNAGWAFFAVVVQDIWRMWPFMFMLIYAGLTGISKELIEAAQLDGANFFQKTFRIIIPLLKPTIVTALLLRLIDAMRIFSEVFVMTEGGPGNATTMLSIYISKQAFSYQNVGLAAAMAMILMLISLMFAFALVRKNLEVETA